MRVRSMAKFCSACSDSRTTSRAAKSACSTSTLNQLSTVEFRNFKLKLYSKIHGGIVKINSKPSSRSRSPAPGAALRQSRYKSTLRLPSNPSTTPSDSPAATTSVFAQGTNAGPISPPLPAKYSANANSTKNATTGSARKKKFIACSQTSLRRCPHEQRPSRCLTTSPNPAALAVAKALAVRQYSS